MVLLFVPTAPLLPFFIKIALKKDKIAMVQVGMVSPADKKMGSGGSLLGSSFGIGLQSPPSLSYHNEVATLYINDFKSA